MRGISELGVIAIFLVATVLMLGTFTMETGAAPGGVEGGNWTNVSIDSYPTNHSNNSVFWVAFNWTFNDSISKCIVEIGNQLGYQNLTGTVSAISASTDACWVNATYFNDTTVGNYYNASVLAINDSGDGAFYSAVTDFIVDTATPVLTMVGISNHNDTYKISALNGFSQLQNYLNVSWTYVDNTSRYSDSATDANGFCKVEVLWETLTLKNGSAVTSTKQSYANFTDNVTVRTWDASSSSSRRVEAFIPANSITDGIYQGKVWLKPYCTDAAAHEGSITGYGNFVVVNPIPENTWTPLGVLQSATTLGAYINWSLAFDGNISYIAAYEFNNASFRTHEFNQSAHDNEVIDTANSSAVYVYPSTSWTLLRINTTSLDAPGNITVYFNDSGGRLRGNWRAFSNLRANTTKYMINATEAGGSSCGKRIDYLAWFNSSDTRCLGGCWESYYNGWGINNETTIPFGTAYWMLTNQSNITMTVATPLSLGPLCDDWQEV